MSPNINSDQLKQAQALFEREFGTLPEETRAVVIHAPGRSEIAGNHTDHEGGHVIAGALDVAVTGIAVPNGTTTLRHASKGYPVYSISLEDLLPRPDENQTTASLARGMAYALAQTGRTPQGFDIATVCDIPAGGGLSSSAAVEAAFGRAMETLWEGPAVSAVDLAIMSQQTECNYFGKPCGLMDQLSICLGGLAYMDFYDPDRPATAKLDYSFDEAGYALCLVDVGCDHTPFTADYAAVPLEMQQVANALGKKRLCEVDQREFDARLPELRGELGDRAILRAIHYWHEDELVNKRWNALQNNDMTRFLALTRESGASSAMYLQNVSTGGAYQPAMLALGLAERILDGQGAIRIHGGGFGGSIQAFVPVDMADEFIRQMDDWLGKGSSRRYAIEREGAWAAWL